MAGETEQKDLPASQRKLRKAREQGEVANSADFVTALGFTAGLIYLLMSWPKVVTAFSSAFRVALDRSATGTQGSMVQTLVGVLSMTGDFIVPLMVIVASAALAGHIIHKKGFVFSMTPITPNFSRIDPTAGFQRIFSMRNGLEFLISVVRIAIWLTIAAALVWFALPDVLTISECGQACIGVVAWSLTKKILIVAVILLILFGVLDLPLQIFLFLRDQRMSRSEFKREFKEQEGSPEMAGARKEQHRQMASGSGSRSATLVVMSSHEVVALQYDPVSQPIPIVLAKAAGRAADPILKAAELGQIPLEVDPRLARELFRVGIGGIVPEKEFNAVATALVRHGKAG
jgi:type III secretion protein U